MAGYLAEHRKAARECSCAPKEASAHKNIHVTKLQQVDRSDLQRVTLYVPFNIHAEVVFRAGCFQSFSDFCIAGGIELEELLVFCHDAETARGALQCAVTRVGVRVCGYLFGSLVEPSLDPEQSASNGELGRLLEEAVLDLPDEYRTVIMLRDVEELSISETATALDLTEQNVKVRLHRGRAMMRDRLFARVGASGKNAFPFMGNRCDRVVVGVFARLKRDN
jgi:RNA polymerase sigma factor (sigma-70 family)